MSNYIEPWHWPHPARWSDLTGEDPHGIHMICPRCEGVGCRRCDWSGIMLVEGIREGGQE